MNSKNKLVLVAAMIVIATLWLILTFSKGGGTPLPPDKAEYAGEWKGPDIYLLITRDSKVSYKRTRQRSQTSLNLPIRHFQGDNFSVGYLFTFTTFFVSKPPYQDGDKWKMVVDGVELTRSDSGQFE